MKKKKLKLGGPTGGGGENKSKLPAGSVKLAVETPEQQAARMKLYGLPMPTAADSLAVYQNSLAVNKFYTDPKRGYSNISSKTAKDAADFAEEVYSDFALYKINAEEGVKRAKQTLEQDKAIYDTKAELDNYKFVYGFYPDFDKAIKANKVISPYQHVVQDRIPGVINPSAPAQYSDFRIKPSYTAAVGAELTSTGYVDPGALTVLHSYDPLDVKPWSMRTEAEKEYARKRFNGAGAAPTTAMVKPKPKPTKFGQTDPQTIKGIKPVGTDSAELKPSIKPKPTGVNPTYPYFSTPTVNVEGSHDVYGYDPDAKQWNLIDVVSPQEAKMIYKSIGQKDLKSMKANMQKITPSAKFELGGFLKAAIPMAASFIPGVGNIAQSLLTTALAANQSSATNPVVEERGMTNPHGLKYGGSTPANLRAMHGGSLKSMGNGIHLAKGRPHSKGGIKGDTDADGKAEIEFEGGELFLDKEGYMISKPIAKKYMPRLKTLSSRSDSAAKATAEYLKKAMIADNEVYRQENTSSDTKFAIGGTIDPLNPPRMKLNLTRPGLTTPSMFTSFTPGGVPIVGSDTMPLSAEAFVKAQSKKGPIIGEDYYSTNDSQSLTPPTAGGGTGRVQPREAATPDKAPPFTIPNTKGDKLFAASQFIAPIFNLASVAHPAEVVKPNYNPYNNVVLNNLAKMRINMKPIENQYTRALSTGMRNLSSLGSTGARFTNANALNSELANQKSLSILQGQQAQNELTQYKDQVRLAIGEGKVNAQNVARLETNANRVARQNIAATAFGQVGQGMQQIGLNKNQALTNNVLFKTLQGMSDYKFNEQEFESMLTGVKPEGMQDSEWIMFKNVLDSQK